MVGIYLLLDFEKIIYLYFNSKKKSNKIKEDI